MEFNKTREIKQVIIWNEYHSGLRADAWVLTSRFEAIKTGDKYIGFVRVEGELIRVVAKLYWCTETPYDPERMDLRRGEHNRKGW